MIGICIGGGPSLTQAQVDYVRGKGFVIAINDAYLMAPWADILYACDLKWWDWHYEKTKDFKGSKITQDPAAKAKYPDLEYIRGVSLDGFSLDPSVIHTGKNSGYQAVNLAVLMGANKIILLGFDHRFPRNKAHWFGDHPDGVRSWYTRWMPGWEIAAKQLERLDIKVINCTPGSALRVFECRPLEDVL